MRIGNYGVIVWVGNLEAFDEPFRVGVDVDQRSSIDIRYKTAGRLLPQPES